MTDITLYRSDGIRQTLSDFVAEASHQEFSDGIGVYRDGVLIQFMSLEEAKRAFPQNPGEDHPPS